MPKVTKVCPSCGNTFETYPSINAKTCSRECRAAQMRVHPNKPRKGDSIPCDSCGTVFYRQPSAVKADRRYCSVECGRKGIVKPRPLVTCKGCGKKYQREIGKSLRAYCSAECYSGRRILRPLDRMHNGRPARLDNYGYVLIWEPGHPNKTHKGWQYEHRIIGETILGRYLETHEHVHHINGIKDDNRVENLQVLTHSEHSAITHRELWAGIQAMREELDQYRAKYGPL